MSKFQMFALVFAGGLSVAQATDHIVDIRWNVANGYTYTGTVERKKYLDVCGKLDVGTAVAWSFDADAPLRFNVHYQVGNGVAYPVKVTTSKSLSDTFNVKKAEDYCWMWVNKSAQRVGVRVHLKKHTKD
jgi:hypothetical protein